MHITRIFTIAGAIIAIGAAHAQTLSFEPMPLNRALIEVGLIHGTFNGSSLSDGAGLGIVTFRGNFPLGAKTNLDVIVPISSVGNPNVEGINNDVGATQLGNIGVAVQLATDDARRSVLMLGANVPTAASNYFAVYPIYDDWMHMERYLSDVLTLKAAYTGRIVSSAGLFVGCQIEPRILIPTGSSGGTCLWLGDVGASAGYDGETAAFMVEFENLINLTYTDKDVFNAVTIGGQFKGEHLRGTLYLQIPANAIWSKYVTTIVGLKVGYVI